MNNKEITVTALALRGLNIIPNTVVTFDISRDKSITAVQKAMGEDEKIFLIAQKDSGISDPKKEDFYEYGTYCKIKQIIKNNRQGLRVIVEGLKKCKMQDIIKDDKYLVMSILPDDKDFYDNSTEITEEAKEAMLRVVKELVKEYSSQLSDLAADKFRVFQAIENIEDMLSKVASDIIYSLDEKQKFLESNDLEERYDIAVRYLIKENQIISIKKDFQKQLKDQMDKNQKEYIMREQLKIIQNELGENSGISEAQEYEKKLKKLKLSTEIKEKLQKEINRFKSMPTSSQEANVLRNYLDTVFDLPFDKYTQDNKDLEQASKILDKDHYGLEKVKTRVLEYLAVRILNPDGNSPILCLVGPPGTGKTSIAKSVAESLGRKYVRISLGGVRDEAEIRGHRKTYIGAMPGRLVEGLKNANVMNPLMLLDEIDKVSSDYKGDTSSALLEVLDAGQNKKFRDHYIEIPIDLSNVLFIATANTVSTIPKPLLDRMEVIEINSYTENEKFHIAKNYLIDKQLKANGLTKENISITDAAIKKIIHNYTREAGVRNLERKIGDVYRKSAIKILEGHKSKIVIGENKLEKILGKERISFDMANEKDEVGIVRGLAWTSVGGDTLQIEVNISEGSGKLALTGQMGDVMKESASIALSHIRSIAKEYDIASKFFEEHDFHLHIPQGAVPKDGPSAGITMALALLSASTNKKVRADVAMTGEITLRGRVLAIGGLKEKILAAKSAGIKTIIVPKKNTPDIEELDKEITSGLDIQFVENFNEVTNLAFAK